MRTDIFEIVTYLFKNFWTEKSGLPHDPQMMFLSLQRAGFRMEAINKAFDWLSELVQKIDFLQEPNEQSWHIFTPMEQLKIDAECRKYILFLEQNNILKPKSREILISQLMSLNQNVIEIPDVKWVALLILQSQPAEREALMHLEQLILLS